MLNYQIFVKSKHFVCVYVCMHVCMYVCMYAFTKSLFRKAIKFLLHNCFFSIGNIIIQIIGIPMGPDATPYFANLFLAHKEADWFKALNLALTL